MSALVLVLRPTLTLPPRLRAVLDGLGWFALGLGLGAGVDGVVRLVA